MKKQIKPGSHVHVISRGEYLRKWDVVAIFSVERGVDPVLYGCYCEQKDLWEFLPASKLKP